MVSSSGKYVLGSTSFELSVSLILALTDMPLSESFSCSVYLTQSLESRNTYACRTLRTKIRNFPADLKHMKPARGKTRSHKCGNLVTTEKKDKQVVTLLSTNTAPDPEIHLWRSIVIPPGAMKKPKVVKVYNHGTKGVHINNQCHCHYPPGTTSRDWWKYLSQFVMNFSMLNTFGLQIFTR